MRRGTAQTRQSVVMGESVHSLPTQEFQSLTKIMYLGQENRSQSCEFCIKALENLNSYIPEMSER